MQLQLVSKKYSILTASALLAIAPDTQTVFNRLKFISLAGNFLQFLDLFILEFVDFTAFNTDDVVVVVMAEDIFIFSDIVLAPHRLFNYFVFHQRRQGAVDGGPGDPMPFPTQSFVKFIHIKMVRKR
jgi:hypothetical protein